MKRKFREEPAHWVVREVVGLMLCHAFVKARTVGIVLRVNSVDGHNVVPKRDIDDRVSVDVFDGIVRKAWA